MVQYLLIQTLIALVCQTGSFAFFGPDLRSASAQVHEISKKASDFGTLAQRFIKVKNWMYNETGAYLKAVGGDVFVESWESGFLGIDGFGGSEIAAKLSTDLDDLKRLQDQIMAQPNGAGSATYQLDALEARINDHLREYKSWATVKQMVYAIILLSIAAIVYVGTKKRERPAPPLEASGEQ